MPLVETLAVTAVKVTRVLEGKLAALRTAEESAAMADGSVIIQSPWDIAGGRMSGMERAKATVADGVITITDPGGGYRRAPTAWIGMTDLLAALEVTGYRYHVAFEFDGDAADNLDIFEIQETRDGGTNFGAYGQISGSARELWSGVYAEDKWQDKRGWRLRATAAGSGTPGPWSAWGYAPKENALLVSAGIPVVVGYQDTTHLVVGEETPIPTAEPIVVYNDSDTEQEFTVGGLTFTLGPGETTSVYL